MDDKTAKKVLNDLADRMKEIAGMDREEARAKMHTALASTLMQIAKAAKKAKKIPAENAAADLLLLLQATGQLKTTSFRLFMEIYVTMMTMQPGRSKDAVD